ncbi:MAG TPA: hypothetical protein VFV51_17700 [Vicinamibacterales bacterium]|nr:hypothetical protein [Vicinamibacterales bacterium]
MHQFAAKIRELGGDATMYYPGREPVDPVVPRYRDYGVPFTRSIRDAGATDVLVVPETMTGELYTNTRMQRWIWWLSVDNYFDVAGFDKPRKRLRRWLGLDRVYRLGEPGFGHMAQSHYAIDFLRRHGIGNVEYVSDYLGAAFLETAVASNRKREDRVLYNPRKGFDFTRKLIAAAPDVRFVPIENMTPSQIAEVMQSSKVYIDFGHHPGKDRMPREAAICGCCVITSRNGSAGFHEDVPIPAAFKFQRDDESIPSVIDCIRLCLADYPGNLARFAQYRGAILAEPGQFESQVRAFLERIRIAPGRVV